MGEYLVHWTTELGRHDHEPQALVVSAIGSVALTGDSQGFAKIWDLSSQRLAQTVETGHLRLTELALSEDGNRFAVVTGSHVERKDGMQPDDATRSRDTDERLSLVTEGPGSWVHIRDVGSAREVARFRASGYPAAVALSADGRLLVSSGDEVIDLWS